MLHVVKIEVHFETIEEGINLLNNLSNEIEKSNGSCVSSQSTAICSMDDVLIKITPYLKGEMPEDIRLFGMRRAILKYVITLEGKDSSQILRSVKLVWEVLKNSGLPHRLID